MDCDANFQMQLVKLRSYPEIQTAPRGKIWLLWRRLCGLPVKPRPVLLGSPKKDTLSDVLRSKPTRPLIITRPRSIPKAQTPEGRHLQVRQKLPKKNIEHVIHKVNGKPRTTRRQIIFNAIKDPLGLRSIPVKRKSKLRAPARKSAAKIKLVKESIDKYVEYKKQMKT